MTRSAPAWLVLLLGVSIAGCEGSAERAFEECTIGFGQSATPQSEQDRRRQEIMYASTCMFRRGFVFDAERQRQDAVQRRLGDLHAYWLRK